MKREELTQEHLKELLLYNQETGIFTWKYRSIDMFKNARYYKMWNDRYANTIAGNKAKSYNVIALHNKQYLSRRLAWLYVYGEFPKEKLDNIDGDLWNDSIKNLRTATLSDTQNKQKQKINNTYMMGVSRDKRVEKMPFKAEIMVKNKRIYLGLFKTEQEAHNAYVEAKRQISPEFCML